MSILEYFHPEVIAFLIRAYTWEVVDTVIAYIKKMGYDVSEVNFPERWLMSMLFKQEVWLREQEGEVNE